jgi:hypothetical protein
VGRVGGGYLLRPWRRCVVQRRLAFFLRDVQIGGDGDVDGGV